MTKIKAISSIKIKKARNTPKIARRASKSKVYKYIGEDGLNYVMTYQQKVFAEAYLETKADGITAVFKAGYNVKSRKVASAIASENLRKPDIYNYINMKFEEYGLNDDNVFKQHLFILNQNDNLRVKKDAIDMMYKLKDKYAGEKIRVVSEFENMSDMELKEKIKELEQNVERYKKFKKK